LEDGRARAPIDDWLDCHGEKFSARMTPERFLALSESLDLHRVEPESIRVPTTLVGVRSDALVPIEDLRRLAKRLPAGRLVELDSPYGHDAFLKEPNAVEAIVAEAHCPREAAA
jgi:homoserine O-acetyltransferase